MRLLDTSFIAQRYRLPSPVQCSVMPASQSWFATPAVNPLHEIVVAGATCAGALRRDVGAYVGNTPPAAVALVQGNSYVAHRRSGQAYRRQLTGAGARGLR